MSGVPFDCIFTGSEAVSTWCKYTFLCLLDFWICVYRWIIVNVAQFCIWQSCRVYVVKILSLHGAILTWSFYDITRRFFIDVCYFRQTGYIWKICVMFYAFILLVHYELDMNWCSKVPKMVPWTKDGTWFEKIRATGILHCVLFAKFDFHFPYRFNWIVSYLCKKVFCVVIVTDRFSFLCYIFCQSLFCNLWIWYEKITGSFWICMLYNQCQTGDMRRDVNHTLNFWIGSDTYFDQFILLFSLCFIYPVMLTCCSTCTCCAVI